MVKYILYCHYQLFYQLFFHLIESNHDFLKSKMMASCRLSCPINSQKHKDTRFLSYKTARKQQILIIEKLEQDIILHFC